MHNTFNYRGSTIHYDVFGSSTPLLLIHGFAEDRKVWDKQVAFLSEHCKLIVPDLPGSGQSELLQVGEGKVNLEDYAECIHALMNNEGIAKCILLGHSMGGYITLAFAEKYPEHLVAFGLVPSTAFSDNDAKKEDREKALKTIS